MCPQKIKALSRPVTSVQAPGSDSQKQSYNLNPGAKPFAKAIEYTRALNATKMERMFAAPFICQMGRGHVDGVYSMAKDPGSLERFASGSGDGVVKVWDLVTREEVWNAQAHENIVKGMAWTRDRRLLTCASDRTVKLFEPYSRPHESLARGEHLQANQPSYKGAPIATWHGGNAFTSISHHRSLNSFAVSSGVISIYDMEKFNSEPEILRWQGSSDTITNVAFNQIETSILASAATDRSIVLYDLRTSMPLAKTVLSYASNKIAWNPMEAMNFAVANEGKLIHNCVLGLC
jgi:WD repeat and SOF domain-containing protein 1